jgi:hypothetical protein
MPSANLPLSNEFIAMTGFEGLSSALNQNNPCMTSTLTVNTESLHLFDARFYTLSLVTAQFHPNSQLRAKRKGKTLSGYRMPEFDPPGFYAMTIPPGAIDPPTGSAPETSEDQKTRCML